MTNRHESMFRGTFCFLFLRGLFLNICSSVALFLLVFTIFEERWQCDPFLLCTFSDFCFCCFFFRSAQVEKLCKWMLITFICIYSYLQSYLNNVAVL